MAKISTINVNETPKLYKVGVLLLSSLDQDNKNIIRLLQENNYSVCVDDATEDGVVLSIMK